MGTKRKRITGKSVIPMLEEGQGFETKRITG